jgi:anion transporter
MIHQLTYKDILVLLAFVFLLSGLYLPILNVDLRSQRVIVVLVFSIVMWILEPIPHTYTSLLTVGLLYVYVVDSFELAASGFASSLFFFFLLVILIGKSVTKVRLDKYGATLLLSKRPKGTRTTRLFAGNILFLALVVPSGLARAATLIPIVNNMIESNDIDPRANWSRQMYFLTGQINPIASAAIMTGGGMSIVAAEYINSSVMSISWIDWAIYMFLPTVGVFVTSVLVMEYAYPVNAKAYESIQIGEKNDQSLELSREQKTVLTVILALIASWVIGSFIGIPTLVPAIVGVVVLSLPQLNVLTASDVRNANWDILFLTGAILSMINIMEDTNAFDYILSGFTDILYWFSIPDSGVIVIICLFIIVGRLFFSGGAAALVILLPFIIQTGKQFDINTLYLSYSTVLLVGSTASLPFSTSATLLVSEQSSLEPSDIFRFSMITLFAAVTTITVSWTLYWPFIDRLV